MKMIPKIELMAIIGSLERKLFPRIISKKYFMFLEMIITRWTTSGNCAI